MFRFFTGAVLSAIVVLPIGASAADVRSFSVAGLKLGESADRVIAVFKERGYEDRTNDPYDEKSILESHQRVKINGFVVHHRPCLGEAVVAQTAPPRQPGDPVYGPRRGSAPFVPGHPAEVGSCVSTIGAARSGEPGILVTFAERPSRPHESLVAQIDVSNLYNPADTDARDATAKKIVGLYGKPTKLEADPIGTAPYLWCPTASCDSGVSLVLTFGGGGDLKIVDSELGLAGEKARLKFMTHSQDIDNSSVLK